MTIKLTTTRASFGHETKAAAQMLLHCGLEYDLEIGLEYRSNNGGKGTLVCIAPDGTKIGGLFHLADWLRREALIPC